MYWTWLVQDLLPVMTAVEVGEYSVLICQWPKCGFLRRGLQENQTDILKLFDVGIISVKIYPDVTCAVLLNRTLAP